MDFGLCTRISDDPSTWIQPNLANPLRKPGDDFQTIRSDSGHAITRGFNQGVLSDPRIYGTFSLFSWSTFFTQKKLFEIFPTPLIPVSVNSSKNYELFIQISPKMPSVTKPLDLGVIW